MLEDSRDEHDDRRIENTAVATETNTIMSNENDPLVSRDADALPTKLTA